MAHTKKRSQLFVYRRLLYFIFLYFHRSPFCVTLCKPCAQWRQQQKMYISVSDCSRQRSTRYSRKRTYFAIIIGHNMLHRKSGRYINDTGRLFFNELNLLHVFHFICFILFDCGTLSAYTLDSRVLVFSDACKSFIWFSRLCWMFSGCKLQTDDKTMEQCLRVCVLMTENEVKKRERLWTCACESLWRME